MRSFNVPARDDVNAQNQANFDALKKGLGMVPNLYATMAWSENGLSRYLAFQSARTSLSNKEKEAINLVVSEVNGCRYCLSAHTIIGKMNGFSDDEVLRIRSGEASDHKLDALVKIAREITINKGRASDASLEAFYAAGYDNGILVDLILQVSDKTAMNYLHNLTKVAIDFPIAPELTLDIAA